MCVVSKIKNVPDNVTECCYDGLVLELNVVFLTQLFYKRGHLIQVVSWHRREEAAMATSKQGHTVHTPRSHSARVDKCLKCL